MLLKSIKHCEADKKVSPCHACHWQKDCLEYGGYEEPRKLQHKLLIIAHRHSPPRELLKLLSPIVQEGFVSSPRFARADDVPGIRAELKNMTPDLVIVQVDTGKPIELISLLELSLSTPCLPIIAVSLRDDPDFTVRLVEKGAQSVLYARGLTSVRLRAAIREAVERERRVRVRRAQTELERIQQENLLRLIEALPDAVIALTKNGQVLIANSAAQGLFSCSAEDMQRTPFALPLNEGKPQEIEVFRKDGSLVPVEMRLTRTMWNGEEGYLAVLRDISERKNLEATQAILVQKREKLRRLEGIRALASGIAHEFNNLLMGIMGHASLAASVVERDGLASQSLNQIIGSGERAASLTHQLLAFSGQGRFVIEKVVISDLIKDVIATSAATAGERIDFSAETLDGFAAVEGDPTLLRSLVYHLVTNAVEAIHEKGTIAVRTFVKPVQEMPLKGFLFPPRPGAASFVGIEISDTGCGLEGSDTDQIFEPFVSTKGIGRGLGLAAVVGIVRSHAGSIRVVSKRGQGTTFTVILPAVTADKAQPILRGASLRVLDSNGESACRAIDKSSVQ